MATIVTYPLNGITYGADDVATYLCTRTSGVYSKDNNFEVTVSGTRKITVSAGMAWMNYDDFKGISVAMKESANLTVPEADGTLDRIDRVVLQFDAVNNLTALKIKTGTPAAKPVAPDIVQTHSLYELGLCTISVAAGSVEVTAAHITDTRLDESVCGIMSDGVTGIPTAELQAEARAKVASLEESATASAAAAAKSATAAETSNQAAQDAAENASTSETNAKASQTAAASSASTASSKASAASTSATKAANSATAAASSATSAANSATEAAASAKEAAAGTSDFTGASSSTAGVHGLVPAPAAGAQESYLRGDGTWAEVQEYTLPEATADTLGGVKVGDNITVSGGTISVTKTNVVSALGFTPSEGMTFETLPLPTQSGGLIYTGSAQSPTWSNYDSSKMAIVDGTTSATNAGTYYVSFVPKVGYCWSDGTMLTKTASWIIGASGSLIVPSQSGTLTYNTAAQSPTWSNYDSTKLTIGGTTRATNAGTYTATFTPKANYAWYDGTTSTKSVTWTISKAAGKVTLNATTAYGSDSGSLEISSYGNGTVTLESDYFKFGVSSWWTKREWIGQSGAKYTYPTEYWKGSAGAYTYDAISFEYTDYPDDDTSMDLTVTVEETTNVMAASAQITLRHSS